jgi:segregation and condensation protein B
VRDEETDKEDVDGAPEGDADEARDYEAPDSDTGDETGGDETGGDESGDDGADSPGEGEDPERDDDALPEGDDSAFEADPDAASDEEETSKEGLDAEKIRGVVEAVLMTSDSPVTPGKLQALLKGVNGRDLRQAVDALNEAYAEGGHAMTITEIAGGFQVVTRREFGPWVRKFHDRSQVRLSQAALETLAIIAFKQPVTRIEVDNVRGVDSGGVLRTLMELNMIRIVGRSEGVGRPMLFGTTRDFMTHFGLRSLADLPKPKELEELLAEGERKARRVDGEGAAAGDGTDATDGDDPGTAPDESVLEEPSADATDEDGTGEDDTGEDEAADEDLVDDEETVSDEPDGADEETLQNDDESDEEAEDVDAAADDGEPRQD